jgi:hypothetical protein
VAYEATKLIDVNGNFTVQSGGKLKMNSEEIVLKPGFEANAGSTVHVSTDVDWVCIINKYPSPNPPNAPIASHNLNNMDDLWDYNITASFRENNISHNEDIKIFPNPVTEILTIELSEMNEKTNIAVYDITGILLYEKSYFETQTIQFNFTNYQSGIYIVKINNTALSSVGKVIKK